MSSHPKLATAFVVLGWLTALVVIIWVLTVALAERHQFQERMRKAGIWLHKQLVLQLLAWLALPVLVVELVRVYRDNASTIGDQLLLVGLILAAAILAQVGNDLLARLTKVGPIEFKASEFVEHQIDGVLPELKELPRFLDPSSSKGSVLVKEPSL